MDNNYPKFIPPYQSPKPILEEIGLPDFVDKAFSNDVRTLAFSNRDWGLPEHEKDIEKQLLVDLQKLLSDEQNIMVIKFHDLMLKKSCLKREYMFYSRVKQGVRFHKGFQSI